jgi:hypothetical protein
MDPGAYGNASTPGWTAVAFSQNNPSDPPDQEILTLDPDMVPRAIAAYNTGGLQADDYNFSYPAAAEAEGIAFLGGVTTTVIFQDEFPSASAFDSVVACDATGTPVYSSFGGYYRASIASPGFRPRSVRMARYSLPATARGKPACSRQSCKPRLADEVGEQMTNERRNSGD